MFYVSQLQGTQIWDAWGEPVGRCTDVLVDNLDHRFPRVCALAVQNGGPELIDAAQISGLYPSIILTVPKAEVKPYHPKGDELWLVDRVLDRQIVDTEGRRVVRVNDIQIAHVRDRFRLTGVDVGAFGLLRRLGLEGLANRALRLVGRSPAKGVVPWEDVAPLQQEDPLRLRISRDKISTLPPADIASILSDLDPHTGEALIASFDDQTLADALEEVPPDLQMAVLAYLNPERAADVLEEMAPDEAADLLGDLGEASSDALLELMEEEEAQEVRTLLAYPVDSAGGIMTTEFSAVPVGLSIGEALEHLRASDHARQDEAMYDVYAVDAEGRLQGRISLRDLVMAPPEAALDERLDRNPITVGPYTAQEEVAYQVAKYDLLAVPVVDDAGGLLGIVTVDDAIDAVLPTAWKKRIPRFFTSRRQL